MNDLGRQVFELGMSINRSMAETYRNGPRVVVQIIELRPDGMGPTPEPQIYPNCHAEVFPGDDTLTITAMSGEVVREYTSGEWLEATGIGSDGRVCYNLRAGSHL